MFTFVKRIYKAIKDEFSPKKPDVIEYLVKYQSNGDYWGIYRRNSCRHDWEGCGTGSSRELALERLEKIRSHIIITGDNWVYQQ